MRVAVVLVVASACLALGQSASLGEVKRNNAKESKSLAMREILRELIDELSTAKEQTNEASVPKGTNHAPLFYSGSKTIHITAYADYKPGTELGFVEAYDTDPFDTVTLTLKGDDEVKDYFDLKTVGHNLEGDDGKPIEELQFGYRGYIYLKKTFDPEMTYNFEVEARDNGTVQKSATKNVVITLMKSDACLPGYTFAEAGRCLKLVTDPASFSDGQAYCKQELKEGGKTWHRPFLAEPKNIEQNQKIANLLKSMEMPVWIGAKLEDSPSHNYWTWRAFGSSAEVVWSNWMPGEPDIHNPDRKERCAAMVGAEASASENAGQWVDLPCSGKLPFVCEHFNI